MTILRGFGKGPAVAALALAAMLGAMPVAAQETVTVSLGVRGIGAFGEIDPHFIVGDMASFVAVEGVLYESLARYRSDGGIELRLAEAIEPEDTEGKVWRISLKPGVTFHNGKPLTADDVIFSLTRVTQPGAMAGGFIGQIEALEKIDDLTLRVTLPAPRSWFPQGVADGKTAIVPVDFDPANPVGTGPYRLGSIEKMQYLTLDRYDGYHGDPGKADQLVVRFFADASAQLNAVKSGQVDIISAVEPAMLDEVEGDATLGVYSSPAGGPNPIQMRTDVAPFSDVRLRQALRLVIDREAVLWSGHNGYGQIGNDLYGRADPDYAASLIRTRDVEAARKLIEEAGLTGTTLQLSMLADMGTALVLAENAKEIGLNIEVQQLDSATFFGNEYFERPFFGGDVFPAAPLMALAGLVDGPAAGLDQVKWRDQDYFDLYNEASRTLDPVKRGEVIAKMQQILFDRGAWLIAVDANENAIYRAGLTGLPASDFTGYGVFRALPDLLPAQAE